MISLDFGAFSTAEKQALLTAAKAELLARITGSVSSGGSAAQNYSLAKLSDEGLNLLINGLTDDLGLSTVETRVRPNFSKTALPRYNTESENDVASNTYSEADSAGNLTVSPASANHTAEIEITDPAPVTKVIAVATSGTYIRAAGDRVTLRINQGVSVAGIVIEIRAGGYAGTLLFSYTTDGSGADNLELELVWNGSEYRRVGNAVPVV